MGLSSSDLNSKGRRLITSKLETATKTGVLNLAELVKSISNLPPKTADFLKVTTNLYRI